MSVQPSRRAQRAAPSSALLDRLILKAKLASDEAFRAIESESQGTASRRRSCFFHSSTICWPWRICAGVISDCTC